MMENPLVSICCLTYNQEKYIADALDGFIQQKTDFKTEILIHDDASTDRTPEIIKKYEKKYPELINPVYETENKYSKGYAMSVTFSYPRAKGRYIALCEGDDYWIDPYKLQKQVHYFEKHPDCTFCFTNAMIKDLKGNKEKVFIPYDRGNEKVYTGANKKYNLGEIALLGFIPTASFMFPSSNLIDPPSFYYEKHPAGDIMIKLLSTAKGYAWFINDITCVYRANRCGSLMTEWRSYSSQKIVEHNQGYINLFNAVDEYSKYQYSEQLDEAKLDFEFDKLFALKDKEVYKNKRYQNYFYRLGFSARIKFLCSVYFPNTCRIVKKVKNKAHGHIRRNLTS